MPLLRHLAVLLAFLAALVRPAPASAFTPPNPETRVKGFEVAARLLVGELGAASHDRHQGIGAAYDENASGYRFAAEGAKSAYEEALAGGKHAGTLRNYAGRSAAEVQKAIGSYERQVALHGEKIANPAKFAARWGQMSAREQAGLIKKWGADAARNQELADVLRGLLRSR